MLTSYKDTFCVTVYDRAHSCAITTRINKQEITHKSVVGFNTEESSFKYIDLCIEMFETIYYGRYSKLDYGHLNRFEIK